MANRADAFKGNFEAEYRAANIRLMDTVEDRETRVNEIKPEFSKRGHEAGRREAKYTPWTAKRDAVTESAEVNLYRYRPDLSNWTAKQ